MKMNDYISDFTKHLTEALEIGQTTLLSEPHADIHNVLICGLGGSGIGGTIVNDLVSENINVPISATKDYSIPNFVDENTLVIASSYSGNTEETLYAFIFAEFNNFKEAKSAGVENKKPLFFSATSTRKLISSILNSAPLNTL